MAQQDMQNLMQTWMQQQQKLWTEWAKQAQQVAQGADVARLPVQGLSQWKQAVEQTLDIQKEATRAWAERVAEVEGAPEEVKRWAAEGVQLLEQWSDAQRGVWEQWFTLMDQSGTAAGNPAKQMMAGWEQMAAQMQSFQKQWADAFAMTGKKGKKGGG